LRGIGIGQARQFVGRRGGPLEVGVNHGDELHVLQIAINSCVVTAHATHADDCHWNGYVAGHRSMVAKSSVVEDPIPPWNWAMNPVPQRWGWLPIRSSVYHVPMGDDGPRMTLLARRPVIGITMGDPAGIGAEIVVKALADPAIRGLARYVVFGMNELIGYAADLAEIDAYWWRLPHDSDRAAFDLLHEVVVLDYDEFSMLGPAVHRPTKQGGAASLRFLDDALKAVMKPAGTPASIDGLVTAPICKASWLLAGCRQPGHTELIAKRTRSRRVGMMFVSPRLKVVLATTHVALMDLRNLLTIGRVFDPIEMGHEACMRLGVDAPRVAVCGLNPHASEGGAFGDEERRVITPAIEMAQHQGIDARGPFPADVVFRDAVAGKYDLVVAMYHDQALIPLKLLDFDRAVNVTLGTPIVRTSPDHGTAFDIVGRNKADPGSMKCAVQLAVQMVSDAERKRGNVAG